MTDEELIARLRKVDEYEPLGHDGWEAADRIEALTEQLAAARKDAEEAEAYAGELEAKLAKAVKSAFEEGFLAGTEDGWVNNPRIEIEWKLSKALAKIKGGKDE